MDDNWGSLTPWPEAANAKFAPVAVGRRPKRPLFALILGWVAIVMAIAALVGAAVSITQGRRSDHRARQLNALARQLDRDQQSLAATIEAVNHRADAPIGKSEQVANALSKIDEAAGNVFGEANQVEAELSRAVGLENSAGPGAGRSIYDGSAADAVRRLQSVLQGAQLTLAAAQQAATELRESGR